MRKKLSLFLSMILIVSLLAACGGGSSTTTAAPGASDGPATTTNAPATNPNADRIVHMAVNAAWQTFDPYDTNALIMLEVLANVYEPLVFFDYDNGNKPVNKLAESYTVDTAGTTYVFKIRQGVKFHNGETLTADDVVFSLKRAQEHKIVAVRLEGVTSIEKTGDYEVTVKLDTSRAAFIANLAKVYIMNKKWVEEHNDNVNEAVCGTGPYKVDKLDLASRCEISQFADYWGEKGTIKGATWDVITDSATQAMGLEGGSLDFLAVAHSQYAGFDANSKFTVGKVPTFHAVFVCFNPNKAPFDNKLVRQAMCYLINNEEIAIACFEGMCETDTVLLNRNIAGLPSWDVLKEYDYPYDPEKGLELLRQAGYDTTKEIDLGTIISYAEGHYITKACPIIQADLAKYNIKLEINAMETNAFAKLLYAGDFTMAMAGGGWGGDASMYKQIFATESIGGSNFFQYGNPTVDELFDKAAAEMDTAKRAELYRQIIEILMDDAPGKSVGHKYNTYAWTNDLVPVLRREQYFLTEWSWK